MSVSATAPTYSDPERLVPFLPSERADTARAAAAERAQHGGKSLTMFGAGDDEPSFWDLLDVINPLQHIPVVNTLYQELTGDKIGVGARLAGGALFGGPLGLIASAVNMAIEEDTGADIGGHALALFRDDPAVTPATAVAQAPAAPDKPPELAMAAPPADPAAPVIPLPDVPSAQPRRGAMMFAADGSRTDAATAPPPVAVAAPQAAGRPLPLAPGAPPARMMPAPQRNPALVTQNSPPPITVPVSNSGLRSNVPITGRDPVAHAAPNALAVQKAAAAQGLAGQSHPMLPPTDAGKPGGNADWFSAMNQALDKYDRAGSLAARPAPTTVTVQ